MRGVTDFEGEEITSLEALALLFDRAAMLYDNVPDIISVLGSILAPMDGSTPPRFTSSGFNRWLEEEDMNQVRHAMAAMMAGLSAGGLGILGMQLRELFGRNDIPDYFLNVAAGSLGALSEYSLRNNADDIGNIIRRDWGQ